MGAGCSSPIRKLGKRSKRKCSEPYGADNLLPSGAPNTAVEQRAPESSSHSTQNDKSPSFYIHQDKQNEDTKMSEQSLSPAPQNGGRYGGGVSSFGEGRTLLHSPTALSPAPSTCYSPSPATTPDLTDLTESLRAVLFATSETNKSKLMNSFVDHITVIFVTSDHLEPSTISKCVFSQVEPHIRNLCAEHDFGLKWIDLSRSHLVETFYSNNLIDITSRLMSLEYERNNQRVMILMLTEEEPSIEAMLPGSLDGQLVGSLEKSLKEPELFDKWYSKQIINGTHDYRLKALHTVLPDVTSSSQETRFNTMSQWYKESSSLVSDILGSSSIESQACLESIIETLTKFILDKPIIQKKTFLIKSTIKHQVNQQSLNTAVMNRGVEAINNLTRVLSDPNKLIIKKNLNPEDYINTVCDWIQDNLSKSVENILEDMNSKTRPHLSFEKTVYIELTQQCQLYNDILEASIAHFEDYSNRIFDELLLKPITQPDLKALESNLDLCAPLFICGLQGCGKSTIISHLIKRCNQEFVANSHIVYRFCGNTLDSITEERTLRSVCEQFCQLHGEHISAASRIYSNRKETLNVLSRILRSAQISMVLLDGLDQLDRLSPARLDWLSELELSPRHRIIITLTKNSNLYYEMLNIYPPSCFYDLEEPAEKHCQSVVELAFKRAFHERYNGQQKTPPNINSDLLASYFDQKERSYSYTYAYNVGHLLLMDWNQQMKMNRLDNDDSSDDRQATVILAILSRFEAIVSPYLLSYLLVALDSTRYGLLEYDIIQLIASNAGILKTFYSNHGSTERKFPAALWSSLKYQLEPWLVYIICDKNIRISIGQNFSKLAVELYAKRKFKNIVDEVRKFLLEYFSRPLRDFKKISPANPEVIQQSKIALPNKLDQTGELREDLSKLMKMQSANHYTESTYLALLTDPTKAKDQLLNRYQFYGKFFYSCNPEEFIEDYDRYTTTAISTTKSNSGNVNELSHLVNYIRSAIYPLRYDGNQIFSQVYCRAYEAIKSGKHSRNRRIQDILNLACSPPVTNLLPLSEASVNCMKKSQFSPMIVTSTATTQQQQQQNKNSSSSHLVNLNNCRQRLYTIEGNHRHMISISPERGTLVVWDIYEEKSVRIMNNLDQPRDLRMIDQKRAVILCNRELKVYDLDTGELLTKLKGVMNQKMPFFEIHGEQYVVALARNRMYVNMLNLVTGELETTFKVGEDRFLNSLLVSANGGICVCGDETQKPFPLLVWDLNERRLLYDLRIDRHEFLTKISAISDDGHYVASACRQLTAPNEQSNNGNGISGSIKTDPQQIGPTPNFLVVYDLNSGTMFKKWKPGLDSCSISISLSPSQTGKVLNGVVNSNILVWDLATGAKRHTLVGHTAPVDFLHVQNDRLFSMDSTCRDRSLRIWDIEKGTSLAVFTPDSPVNCCRISVKGDALVCGFSSETRLSTLALCRNELLSDIVKRNRRRKSSGSTYIFDEPAPNRKTSQPST